MTSPRLAVRDSAQGHNLSALHAAIHFTDVITYVAIVLDHLFGPSRLILVFVHDFLRSVVLAARLCLVLLKRGRNEKFKLI